MSLRYSINKEDSFIEVRTEGVFSFLEAYEMWEQVAAACAKHDCYDILGESHLDKPLPSTDAYEHLAMLESVGISGKHRIAWIAGRPELLDNLRLAETVVRNRSPIDLRVFLKRKDALQWIRERGRAAVSSPGPAPRHPA